MEDGRFKKGHQPHNKGKKLTLEQIEKMKNSYKNRKRRHRNGISRHNSRVIKWRKDVFYRDKEKCQKCGITENLDAHHIIPWKQNIQLRFEVSNGETLCRSCHMSHEFYKRKRNAISTEFKKGNIPWNKGLLGYRSGKRKPHSEETKKKIRESKMVKR